MNLHALVCGINDFPGTQNDLAGCVNDARDISRLMSPNKSTTPDELDKLPFFHNASSLVTLLDKQATLKNAIAAVGNTLSRLNDDDMAFLWFSQHGTFADDAERHEALVFADFGLWQDTKVIKLLSARNPKSFVFIGTDACHTGTKDLNAARPRFLAPGAFPAGQAPQVLPGSRTIERLLPKTSLPNVIHFAGCQASEVCYDTSFGGRPNGAFTYYLLKAIATLKPGASFGDLYKAVCHLLPSKQYPQSPSCNALPDVLAMPLPLRKG